MEENIASAEASAASEKSVERLSCITCGDVVIIGKGVTRFSCPACSEIIVRCAKCRKLGRKYKSKCGFEGP